MHKVIRIASVLAILLGALTVPFSVQAQAEPQGKQPVQYYVSVGTSLAAGIQADRKTGADILTDDAYTDKIHQRIRGQIQNLEHIKLGCPAESSQEMIDGIGSLCYSPEESQLQTAKAILEDIVEGGGEIALITIDIGANDLLPCLQAANIPLCVAGVFAALQTNLQIILPVLQAAAPGAPIIAINYYNPYLSAWKQDDPGGQALAHLSNQLVLGINSVLGAMYGLYGIPVADVAGAFETDDFSINGNLPINVKIVCRLTWNCSEEHPNIHPNDNGYKVIARTVEDLMRQLGLIQTPQQGQASASSGEEHRILLPMLSRH